MIFRIPCPIGMIAASIVKDGRPYAVEVVGDPWEVFSPRGVKHVLRPFLRFMFTYRLKKACENAIDALDAVSSS